MNRKTLAVSYLFIALAWTLAAQEPNGSITIDRVASIKHPSEARWSPSGERIAFLWDDAGNQNLFVVTPGEKPMALSDFAPNPDDLTADIGRFEWIADDEILLQHGGKLFRVAAAGVPRQILGIDGVSAFVVSRDRVRLAMVRDGQLFIAGLDGTALTQVTHLEGSRRLVGPVFSPDGRHLAFTTSRFERVLDLLAYNGNKQGLYRNEISDYSVGILSLSSGSSGSSGSGAEPTWIAVDGRPRAVQWAGDRVLYERISTDMKTREIVTASLDGTTKVIRTDHDPRWWSPQRRDARTVVSPDGRLVAFFADETGWSHLYVTPTETDAGNASEARRLTSGQFEAGFGSWSSDSKRIAFYDNENSPMERFVRVVDVETGEIEPIVTEKGVNYWPRFSPDGSRLVLERTDVENSVDLYVADVKRDAPLTRLSISMPEEIQKADLTAPGLSISRVASMANKCQGVCSCRRTSTDPAAIRAIRPSFGFTDPAPTRIFSAGILSATGSTTRQPSISCSRATWFSRWTIAEARAMVATGERGITSTSGARTPLDVASGADYLKTLSYVDPDRIGVWGLSYGGFLTLQVLTRTPTLFRAGIDVAGVTDWATWGLESNGGWITGRMDRLEDNAEGYVRTASIKHMETLERPLLILHGTADVNVAFRESLNLVDVLLKQGKAFDFEVYPGELHFFRRKHILRDAWKRAEQFFDAHLKQGARLTSH